MHPSSDRRKVHDARVLSLHMPIIILLLSAEYLQICFTTIHLGMCHDGPPTTPDNPPVVSHSNLPFSPSCVDLLELRQRFKFTGGMLITDITHFIASSSLKTCTHHGRIGHVAPPHDAFLQPIYSCAGRGRAIKLGSWPRKPAENVSN